MNLRTILTQVLGVAALAGLSGCMALDLMDEKLYSGSTPSGRDYQGNSIFERKDLERLKAGQSGMAKPESTDVTDGASVTPVPGGSEVPSKPEPAAIPSTTGMWEIDMNKALAKARSSNKPVLISFSGSDWCEYCQALDRNIFQSAEFKAFAEEIVTVNIDYPKNTPLPAALQTQNEQMQKTYQIDSLPTIVLLRPDGQYIGRGGYQEVPAADFVASLRQVLFGKQP